LLGVAAAGGVGVAFGRWVIAGAFDDSPPAAMESIRTGLAVGEPFPDVALLTATGDTVVSTHVVAGHGRVVLFMDPQCPSCGAASRRWQRLLDAHQLPADAVAGITGAPLIESETYRSVHGLSFPIYRDIFKRFRLEHGVDAVPYEVVVGSSGRIRSAGLVPDRAVNLREVRRQLAE
jgi:peroxiredoxin